MNLNKQFKFIRFLSNISIFKIKKQKKLTISNALQLRSHPDEVQVKLRTRIANDNKSMHHNSAAAASF
jgi:hypothetical protein